MTKRAVLPKNPSSYSRRVYDLEESLRPTDMDTVVIPLEDQWERVKFKPATSRSVCVCGIGRERFSLRSDWLTHVGICESQKVSIENP